MKKIITIFLLSAIWSLCIAQDSTVLLKATFSKSLFSSKGTIDSVKVIPYRYKNLHFVDTTQGYQLIMEDSTGKVIGTQNLGNPLESNIETFDEKGNGEIHKVKHSKKEVEIKVPHNKKVDWSKSKIKKK